MELITKRFYLIFLILFFSINNLLSQEKEKARTETELKSYLDSIIFNNSTERGTIVRVSIFQGNQIPYIQMSPISIYGQRTFVNPREKKRYDKLCRDVKKAYPYAKMASKLLNKFEKELISIEDEKERKKYYKKAEKELREEFEGELKNLTITQGRILIKLIDRETGETTYDLVKQLRGSFSAFMWQSLARLFGSDLKTNYQADQEDRDIEIIVRQIENGDL
jgi:hypothetical protein